MPTKVTQAAATIKVTLEKKNGQTAVQLAVPLDRRGLGPEYVARGLRRLRDVYGEHSVVKERLLDGTPGGVIVYVLDPNLGTMLRDLKERTGRSLTEARHMASDLDWTAKHYGNRGPVRRGRRYVKALVAELEDIQDLLAAESNGALVPTS